MEAFSQSAEATGDVALLFVPMGTYRALSKAAADRNMTIGALLAAALDKYLKDDPTQKE
jgi:hypothetical protein